MKEAPQQRLVTDSGTGFVSDMGPDRIHLRHFHLDLGHLCLLGTFRLG